MFLVGFAYSLATSTLSTITSGATKFSGISGRLPMKLEYVNLNEALAKTVVLPARSNNELSFIDKGVELPLGIKTWNHKHIVRRNKKVTIIIDILDIEHTNIAIGYILFPVLVFPILIRKFLYKMYFFN